MKTLQKGFAWKWIIILVGIILALAVIFCVVLFFTQTSPKNFINTTLEQNYSVLTDRSKWIQSIVVTNNPESWDIPSKNIQIKIVGSQNNFYCGDIKADVQQYSAHTSGAYTVGGWYSVYVVDCGVYYFIYEFTDAGPQLYGPFDQDISAPKIDSISPQSGPIGTIVELKGSNLPGFEGDLNAYIKNSSGEVGFLQGIGSVPREDQTIRVKIESKVCKTNNSYVGECQSGYLTIIPGEYRIYTEPWGKISNEVKFTVL